MSSAIDVMVGSALTASSFDSTSAGCSGGRCKVTAVANDGSGQSSNDGTFWQSASDPTCANQWVQALFTRPATIQNFSIEYDNLGPFFDAQNKYFQLLLNPTSSNPIDASPFINCANSNVNNSGETSVMTSCTINPPQANVEGVKYTWGLSLHNETCQMNVDEIVMFGVPGSTDVSSGSSISGGAIAGIVIASLVLATGGVLYAIRQRNLKIRERTGRLFEFSTTD
ncbi:hypothetical protein HDU98_001693 [Podochytrium sp. JEL0797]|nr:hypothetical protein HDU98_001693 [Podochytrium sp. JEL0797]